MTSRPRRCATALAFAALAVCALGATAARGHIVYGRPTLLGLVAGSERVAHVRVVDPDAQVVLAGGAKRRPVVEVTLREAFKGGGEPGEVLRFATHGHGVADYEPGAEVLVFLAPLERSRELASLAEAGIGWISFQEHDARYEVSAATREALLAAVRTYVAAEAVEGPRERVAALRDATRDLVLSGPERLALGAVQDFAASSDALPLLTPEDVPALVERGVRSGVRPLGVRLALLAELDRRDWVEGAPHWLALLESESGSARERVIAVAGRHPEPRVTAALGALLAGDDAGEAEAAALALASPAHAAAAPALATALEHPSARVRRAAVRALGAMATPAALDALETASHSGADPDLRRRAAAELRKRER